MKAQIISNSPSESEKIGYLIGKKLAGGEIIILNSELGGGKTTFTHGLVKAIESKDRVASPTFTISRLYNGERLDIVHYDFYRLREPGIMVHEIADLLINKKNVIVIEWPGIVENFLPKDNLVIEFQYINEESRKILFSYPKNLSYLMSNYANFSNSN